jgi:phosphate transport system substrate-binding protein
VSARAGSSRSESARTPSGRAASERRAAPASPAWWTGAEGAIGYVDVAYAQENDLGTASMRNAAGEFVDPTLEAIGAAAAPVTAGSIAPTGEISIVDPPASEPRAYPICTFTYVVVPRVTGKASQLQAFVGFALGEGQADGPPLLFRPLPPPVRAFGREQLATIRASG